MSDPTEEARRAMVEEISSAPGDRQALEQEYGKVWDTEELRQEFEVLSFMAPFVVVRRKEDRKLGTLQFQHRPRFYYGFEEDR